MVPGAPGPVLNAAVLGRPVAHSLSPLLHRAGYRALGLDDWAYGAHDLGADDLAAWVAQRDDSWRGLSLTMPLKEAAFAVAATVSQTARLTGAVNTLVRRDDLGWDAHNTDVHGLVGALGHLDHGGSATLLGSGATARSAAVALARLGVTVGAGRGPQPRDHLRGRGAARDARGPRRSCRPEAAPSARLERRAGAVGGVDAAPGGRRDGGCPARRRGQTWRA